jgi:hypothetical protein
MTDKPELLACPLCNSPGEMWEPGKGRFSARCSNRLCGCAPRLAFSREEAVELWNTRPTPALPDERVKLVERLLAAAKYGESITRHGQLFYGSAVHVKLFEEAATALTTPIAPLADEGILPPLQPGDCEHCGHDHPAYSPCVDPPAWEPCYEMDGSVEPPTRAKPTTPSPAPVADEEAVERGVRAAYQDWPMRAISKALAEGAGVALGEPIPYERALEMGADLSGLRRTVRAALASTGAPPLPLHDPLIRSLKYAVSELRNTTVKQPRQVADDLEKHVCDLTGLNVEEIWT